MAYQPSFCERGQVQAGHAQVTVRQRTARSRLRLLIAPLLASAICVTGLFGLRGIAHAQSGSVGYVYDSLGRLIAVYDPSGDAAVYNYDAVGNLLSITNDLSTQFTGVGLSSDSGLGGSTLTIYGTDFCASPTVTINGVNATIVSSTSTQIVVTVPSGATSGAVVVTCGSNQITVGTFTVGSNAPSITSFTPTIGSAGAPVTINGSGFQTNPALDAVQFNIPRVYASTATASVITATVPSKATTGHVTVSTPTGQTTSSAYFFVPPPPATVSSIAVTGQVAIGGSPTNVTLTTAGAKALYGFDATAGTQIALSLTNITMPCCYPTATVFNPDGSTLGSVVFNSGNPTTILPDLTLATTGTYSLLIDSSNVTGSLTFALLNTADQSGTISIGGPAVNTGVTGPGQDVSLSFTGAAGQQVSVNLTNSTYPGFGAMVYIIPAGGSVANALGSVQVEGCCGILSDVTLPATGTYTIFIDPFTTGTGSMTVQLFNANDETGTISIGGPAVNTSATVPGQDVSLTFSGTTGQQISVNVTNSTYPNFGAVVYVIPPGGSTSNAVASLQVEGCCGILADVTLPTTGTYTVFIDPTGQTTGSMTVQLFNTADETGTISIGGPAVNTSVTVPGQDASLTFSGTAGQQISVNLTNSTYPNFGAVVYVIPPGGSTSNAVASLQVEGCCGILADVTLPTTGTYTVFIDPTGQTTGSMTVQLFNTADQTGTISIGGSAVNTSATSPGQDASLTFSGTAGQQISVNLTNSTYPNFGAVVYVIPPGGSTSNAVASLQVEGCCGILADVTLPTTGTYTVFIDPTGQTTGSMTVQLWNLGDSSSSVNVSDTYATTILGDLPEMYWRLDEGGPATAINAEPAIKYALAGPTSPDTAISLNGYAAYIGTTKQFSNPSTYSVEIWFKTTTTNGGKLIGFGTSETGSSNSYDRHIYMTNAGQLVFGQYAGSAITVTSTGSYNDGFWHYAAGTYNGSTMALYVDGSQVGSVSAGAPQNYNGYWRIGYDNLNGWPSAPNSYYFQGSIGEAAVYSTALSATQVSNHYSAAGGGSYDSTVLSDSPTSYWKLNESAGPTVADATSGGNGGLAIAGSNNGLYQGGVTYSVPGAISSDNAIHLDGSSAYVNTLFPVSGNTPFTIEVWFFTGTTQGGSLVSFSQNPDGTGTIDRQLYMVANGHIHFVIKDSAGHTDNIYTSTAYNDSIYHYAVAKWDGSTMHLNIDNVLIGSMATAGIQNTAGYWRFGNGNLSGWPAAPTNNYFLGRIDEAAIYSYMITSTQVSNHYHASGR